MSAFMHAIRKWKEEEKKKSLVKIRLLLKHSGNVPALEEVEHTPQNASSFLDGYNIITCLHLDLIYEFYAIMDFNNLLSRNAN